MKIKLDRLKELGESNSGSKGSKYQKRIIDERGGKYIDPFFGNPVLYLIKIEKKKMNYHQNQII